MLTLDDLRALAAGGESENVEFKLSTAEVERACRTVAGMANQSGGVVVFGVHPSGEVVGQEVSERTLEKLAEHLRRVSPGPIHSIGKVPVSGDLQLLVVKVDAGPLRPYRYNGRAYLRTGAVTGELTEEQAQHLLLDTQHQGRRWEEEPSELGVEHLDVDEIQRTVRDGVRLGRVRDPGTDDVSDLLRGLDLLTNDGRLKHAAAVLFGRSDALAPRYIQSQLKVARFLGLKTTAPMGDEHQWVGNIFDLYRRADRFLLDHLRIAAELPKDSWVRVDTPEIPPNAMREAVLNALAHRDYSMWSASITIAFLDDRVEIASPGLLHFGLTPEVLYGPHQSRPWNPTIARVLHQRGLIETWGTGFNRMVDEVRQAGLVMPLVSTLPPSNFLVTFTRPGFTPRAFKAGMTDEQSEVLDLLFARPGLRMGEIVESIGRPRRTVARDLAFLNERGRAQSVGQTSAARWSPIVDP